MIPILYEQGETAFTSNGLGRLRDCISCICTEERNGVYEVDFEYPIDGANFELIQVGRIIGVTHDESGDLQPFDIVSYSRPIDGVVSFHCVHVSYRQSYISVTTGTPVESLADAFTLFGYGAPSNPFTYWTDKTSSGHLGCADKTPRTVRQMLGGIEGSVLDAYGGEYEWDRWTVKLWSSRGQYRDFTIRYGVNMLDFNEELDSEGSYSSVIPYWTNGEDFVVGARQVGSAHTITNRGECIPLDVSASFEDQPTQAQVEAEGLSYLNNHNTAYPSQNIKVSFIRLQDMAEYADFRNLLTCRLCDSINVIFPGYNTSSTFKIVKTVWNVLTDKYDEMELGDLSVSLSEALGISNTLEKSGGSSPTPTPVPEVEDVSAYFTLGGAWTGIVKKAYKYDRMVFFHIEASVGTYQANYGYTIATVASGYRPTTMAVCNAYTTDGSYHPKAVVSSRLETNGNLIVDSQNTTGSYFFVTGFYYI